MSTPNQQPDALTHRLLGTGLRATPQREVVYQTLMERRDHPTADELFTRVKAKMPTISLATVYNCLETLVECDLVKQVNFEREPTRYCSNLTQHAHFIDTATGRIIDIPMPADQLARLCANLPPGFNMLAFDLTIRGTISQPTTPTSSKDISTNCTAGTATGPVSAT
jgi:Fur family peroxide stress response transcriptional regulator